MPLYIQMLFYEEKFKSNNVVVSDLNLDENYKKYTAYYRW